MDGDGAVGAVLAVDGFDAGQGERSSGRGAQTQQSRLGRWAALGSRTLGEGLPGGGKI